MKIIVENSTWNNLGDGFYQSTLFELIKKIFPESNVFVGEGPVERAFKPKEKQLKNALKLNEYEKADIHVFSGPMIQALIESDYKNVIKNIIESGNNYALISCSCNGVKGEKLEGIRGFLKQYPPISFSSRDPYTYKVFKDYVPSSYNGICTAFLVNDFLHIETPELDSKYFVSSFYTKPEPKYFSLTDQVKIEDISCEYRKPLLPFVSWGVNRHLEFYRDVDSNLKNLKIVRTVQGVSNKSNYFNFKYPNSYITYNPITFLSIFKGAEFTISDRVHACAVTLAFGKPAKFLFKSHRAGIFDRLGLDYNNNEGIMYPEGLNVKIKEETKLLEDYIKKSFSNK